MATKIAARINATQAQVIIAGYAGAAATLALAMRALVGA